jgi:hypothetical protein
MEKVILNFGEGVDEFPERRIGILLDLDQGDVYPEVAFTPIHRTLRSL